MLRHFVLFCFAALWISFAVAEAPETIEPAKPVNIEPLKDDAKENSDDLETDATGWGGGFYSGWGGNNNGYYGGRWNARPWYGGGWGWGSGWGGRGYGGGWNRGWGWGGRGYGGYGGYGGWGGYRGGYWR